MLALKEIQNREWPISGFRRRWATDARHDGWYGPVKLVAEDQDVVMFGDEQFEEKQARLTSRGGSM